MLTVIAAITRDRALGRGGDMLYHISSDLKRFKSLTMGHPIIMGRRTLESFPKGPLPGRRNMVVSRNPDYTAAGVEVYPSLQAAIAAAGADAFILGGGQIYAQAMAMADRLLITEIDACSDGADTFFPVIDPDLWRADSIGPWLTDPRSGANFRFVDYSKKSC